MLNLINLFESCDAPRACGVYFQDSASPQMEAHVELHVNIMFYLVLILFSVRLIMLLIMFLINIYFIYSKFSVSLPKSPVLKYLKSCVNGTCAACLALLATAADAKAAAAHQAAQAAACSGHKFKVFKDSLALGQTCDWCGKVCDPVIYLCNECQSMCCNCLLGDYIAQAALPGFIVFIPFLYCDYYFFYINLLFFSNKVKNFLSFFLSFFKKKR